MFCRSHEGKSSRDSGRKTSLIEPGKKCGESLERRLSLAPTAKESLYTQKFYLYLNLTKPSEQVYLSYSRLSSSGEALSPSFLISQIEGLFQDSRENQEILLYRESVTGALEKLSENCTVFRRSLRFLKN